MKRVAVTTRTSFPKLPDGLGTCWRKLAAAVIIQTMVDIKDDRRMNGEIETFLHDQVFHTYCEMLNLDPTMVREFLRSRPDLSKTRLCCLFPEDEVRPDPYPLTETIQAADGAEDRDGEPDEADLALLEREMASL